MAGLPILEKMSILGSIVVSILSLLLDTFTEK